MSFKFGFLPTDSDDDAQTDDTETVGKLITCDKVISREILLAEGKCLADVSFEVFKCSTGLEILHQNGRSLERSVCGDQDSQTSPVVAALQAHSDLQAGQYEGGLKVWECGVDLVNFLCDQKISFQGKAVLELGCGAGLPGLLAVNSGASLVHFQDYNQEVIQYSTIPNVLKAGVTECQLRFFSGDWGDLLPLITRDGVTARYDYLLTAETIYNIQNYSKLHTVFTSLLKKSGVIYVAAKVHYFGVGGNTQAFMEFIQRENVFSCHICHTVEAGIQRQILELRRKDG